MPLYAELGRVKSGSAIVVDQHRHCFLSHDLVFRANEVRPIETRHHPFEVDGVYRHRDPFQRHLSRTREHRLFLDDGEFELARGISSLRWVSRRLDRKVA